MCTSRMRLEARWRDGEMPVQRDFKKATRRRTYPGAVSYTHIERLPCPCEVEDPILNDRRETIVHDRLVGSVKQHCTAFFLRPS